MKKGSKKTSTFMHASTVLLESFARNVLNFVPVDYRVRTLQHWASYLTPGVGRMIVTMGVAAEYHSESTEEFGDTAGAIVVPRSGQILSRMNLMIEEDWVAGERALENLVATAGLHLHLTRRVGFNDGSGFEWLDQASAYYQYVSGRHPALQAEGNMDSAWSNHDGSLSHYTRAKMKSEFVEGVKPAIFEENGELDFSARSYV